MLESVILGLRFATRHRTKLQLRKESQDERLISSSLHTYYTYPLQRIVLLPLQESNCSFHRDVDNDSHVTFLATGTRVLKRLTQTAGKRREILKFAKRKRVSVYFSFITNVSGLLCCWYKDIDIIYRNCYYLWLIHERKVLNLWHLAF
jgi:hypothetical protein